LARLLGYSLAFAGIRLVNYGLIFSALGVSVPWDALSRKVPFLILLSDLPVSVMGIGVREGGVLMAFSDMGSEVNLVSAGLWVSVVEGIVPLVLGLLLLKPFLNRLLNGEAPPRPGLGRRSVMRGCTGPLQGVRDAVQSHFDRRAEAQAGRDAGEEAPRQFVRSLLARRVRGRTLELGCGFHPSARPPGTGPLVALDLSPASLRRLGAGVARVCADACALPFATGAFETVVSMHMVHHLAGRSVGHGDAMLQGTLAEVQRVLRPGGSAVVVDTLISGGLYGVQRFCYPLLQRVAGALGGVPVMFRDTRAVTAGLARAGLPVEETRVLPVLGKALTPWGGSLQWPMGLSPLRDVMVVAARRGGP
jgi:SAM-dependent methyltransferase